MQERSKIGIIGNGFVGNALYNGFTQDDVFVYDEDGKKCIDNYYDVMQCDYIFICVPTPKNNNLKHIKEVFDRLEFEDWIEDAYNKDTIFIIKSTVTPGTCDALQNEYGLNIVSNPEFLTERTALNDFNNPRCIILGGKKSLCLKIKELYTKYFPNVPYHITESINAEFIKYMTNCFFATKITFMNEMKQIYNKLCPDFPGQGEGWGYTPWTRPWDEVVEGFVKDGRVFPEHLNVPGHDGLLGYGGHCFPKDLAEMISLAKNKNVNPLLLQAVEFKNNEVRNS